MKKTNGNWEHYDSSSRQCVNCKTIQLREKPYRCECDDIAETRSFVIALVIAFALGVATGLPLVTMLQK